MTDQEAIITVQAQVWQALITKDFDRLDQLYPEDYSIRHVGNHIENKEVWYDNLRSGTFTYYTYQPISEEVTLDGERAILHSKAKTKARIYGIDKTWTMSFDIPYEKVGGHWRPAPQERFPLWVRKY